MAFDLPNWHDFGFSFSKPFFVLSMVVFQIYNIGSSLTMADTNYPYFVARRSN